MKQRSLVATILFLFIFASNAAPADAAPRAGAKCSKAGLTQTANGKKFTCIKAGNKLVWNKGAIISKATPAALPTRSITPTPKPTVQKVEVVSSQWAEPNMGCTYKEETAFTLKGPVICDNDLWTLVSRDKDSIESRAYRYVIDHWNKQAEGNLTVTFYIDPKAGEWTSQIEAGLRAGARFWGTSKPGSRPIPAFISEDYLYIEETMVKAGIIQNEQSKIRNKNAQGGQAGWNGGYEDPNAYWDFLFKFQRSREDVGFYQVGPHEYTHYAQTYLAKGKTWDKEHMPWVNEGLPSYIGSALGPMSKMPHNQMDNWRGNLKWVTKPLSFFSKPDQEVYNSDRWGDVYPMGAFAAQALVALFGVDGIINYYTDLSTGIGNEAAYKKNFKLGSQALTELMESYVNSVSKREIWSLETLQDKYKEAVAKG